MTEQLVGNVALVTGAAGGIGAAVSRQLAARGACVILTDVAEDPLHALADDIRAGGGQVAVHPLDVTSADDVNRVVAAVEAEHGLVNMAVTCAGIIRTYDFVDLPPDIWDLTLGINLKGTFLVFQAVARRLIAAGKTGSLVGISSVAGRGGRANAADYAASKAGVISVVRSAALAFAKHGITVNAVCPGIVDTEMTRSIHQARARLTGLTPEESFARIAATIPLGRVQTADDVADVVSFLLSPQAAYLTGQSINADGGIEMD